jgi:menaquinone-dependent protoporphyrinogen oxidase
VLSDHGLRVVLADVSQGVPEGPFDAYVIGSAVYRWKWMKQIKQFLYEQRETLLAHPVWLFSTVPVAHPPRYEDAPLDVADLFWCTAPRQHQTFSGVFSEARLSLMERVVAAARQTPTGDYRNWHSIREWAAGIAAVLLTASGAAETAGTPKRESAMAEGEAAQRDR